MGQGFDIHLPYLEPTDLCYSRQCDSFQIAELYDQGVETPCSIGLTVSVSKERRYVKLLQFLSFIPTLHLSL